MTRYIREIDRKGNRNEGHPTEENLEELVEETLLKACIALVRNNIRTVASTANKDDIGHNANLLICADHLSHENREIALKMGGMEGQGGHWGHTISFDYPLTEDSTVEEVVNHFAEIAAAFQHQPYTWADKYNFADAIERIYAQKLAPEVRARLCDQTEFVDDEGIVWNWDMMANDAEAQGEYYDKSSGYVYASLGEFERERS